jgi:phosphatidate cytidylyltransferase
VRLGARVASAVVLAAVLATALWVGGPTLYVVTGLATGIGLHEYAGLAGAAGRVPIPVWVLYPLGGWLFYRSLVPADVPALEWGLGVAVVGGLLASLIVGEGGFAGWALAVGGALWIGLCLGYYLPVLDHHLSSGDHHGLRIVGTTLAAAMLGDIAALFAGSRFGRHKLAPTISPGKTIEGAAASMAATIGLFASVSAWLLGYPWYHGVLLGFLLSVAAQGGDLVESALKRTAGVKDSGRLVPGHGGLLDRMDSLILLGPVVYCYLRAFALS